MRIETVEHDIPTMVHPVRGNSQEMPVNITQFQHTTGFTKQQS